MKILYVDYKNMKYVYILVLVVFASIITPKEAKAAFFYDTATSTNWNIRIDGAAANDNLTGGYNLNVKAADLDGDGKNDLIVGDENYSSGTGAVYIIYHTLLSTFTGTGNTLDLSASSNYNLRIVGTGGNFSLGGVEAADLNNDGRADLVITAPFDDANSKTDSGSVFVLYSGILSSYTGTGNSISLTSSANYNIRYYGPSANISLGNVGLTLADVTGDGRKDILIGASYADYNSRTDSGSVYLINNTLVSAYSSTGNNVDLATSSNYSVRYDGPSAYGYLTGYGGQLIGTGDLNNNGINDIVLGTSDTSFQRSYSGSMYVIYDSLINALSGTGNTVDLSTVSNWNVRFDGPITNGFLNYTSTILVDDINNDGRNELLCALTTADYNSRANSGSMYIIDNSIISSNTTTGNIADMATSTNWSLRIDGAAAGDTISSIFSAGDINGDSKKDLFLGGYGVDNNSRSGSGSMYGIFNSHILYSGTGNTLDLSSTSNYDLRFDGALASIQFGYAGGALLDISDDGKPDYLASNTYADFNSRSNSGSLYLVFNFPHTFTDASSTPTSNSIIYRGRVNASNSVSTISGVQYQVDSNSLTGTWNSCTADDGSFNSTNETYTCQTTEISNGSHTIYVRAYDSNNSYSAQSRYAVSTVSIGDSNSASNVNNEPQIRLSSSGTNDSGKVLAPTNDSNTGNQQVSAIIEPNTLTFSAFLSAKLISLQSLADEIVIKTKKSTLLSNTILAGGGILGVKTGKAVSWQIGNIQQLFYKAYAPASSDKSPAQIIPELQKKPSIVALSYRESDLIPPGRPTFKFNAKTLKIARSIDGITWKVLPTSVVDTKNHTVAALDKVYGYYMIVGK